MYGRRKYGIKQPSIPSPAPVKAVLTFVCSKCKMHKKQDDGITALSITENGRLKILGQICPNCVTLLEGWLR